MVCSICIFPFPLEDPSSRSTFYYVTKGDLCHFMKFDNLQLIRESLRSFDEREKMRKVSIRYLMPGYGVSFDFFAPSLNSIELKNFFLKGKFDSYGMRLKLKSHKRFRNFSLGKNLN